MYTQLYNICDTIFGTRSAQRYIYQKNLIYIYYPLSNMHVIFHNMLIYTPLRSVSAKKRVANVIHVYTQLCTILCLT